MEQQARLETLRELLAQEGLQAYWVPSSDEHLSEYVPPWAKRREWLSGFSGSAGELLVGREQAWLFTDGRYHIQAAKELAGVSIRLVTKEGLPDFVAKLAREVPGFRLGFDPKTVAASAALTLARTLRRAGGALIDIDRNLVDLLWKDQPRPPQTPLVSVPETWSGRPSEAKLRDLREQIREAEAHAWICGQLDEIAWLLDLRSLDDTPFMPIFESYLYVDASEALLFVHGAHRRCAALDLPPDLRVLEHGDFLPFLQELSGKTVVVDTDHTSASIVDRLRHAEAHPLALPSPVARQKSLKNRSEQAAMRRAGLSASVAKTRTLLWLRAELKAGRPLTEISVARQLESNYSEMPDYHGLSFPTISAAGPHSALPHYGGVDETPLRPGELFLVDSGAHIGGGTTDATRTLAVGESTATARRRYTRVLQALGRVACQSFPEGTPGTALDAICRSGLWLEGWNYDHGTGHGVGAWLSVHEGPFALAEQARKPCAITPLAAGMVTSVEPGAYEEGWGGIRLENLYLLVEADTPSWLRLECLTWIPFAPSLIDRDLLSGAECRWLDQYHHECGVRLSPHLEGAERQALRRWIAEFSA